MAAQTAVEVRELRRVYTPRKREPVVALDDVSLTRLSAPNEVSAPEFLYARRKSAALSTDYQTLTGR
jgi:hypothetical protein